jgi:Family of unknown function (DUF5317)
MTLLLAFLLLLLTVPAAGGRLRRLEGLRFRWIWLAVLALGAQLFILAVVPEGDTAVHRVAHLLTYGLVGACVIRNLDIRFMWVVAVGGLLNLIAIGANGGVMPASRSAMETAGLEVSRGSFTNSDAVEGANLAFLGDVFAIPDGWPGANVFSVGDVVLVLGALLVIHAAAGSRVVGGERRALRPAQGSPAAR